MDDDMKRRFERIARAKDSAAKPQRVEAEKQKHQAKTQIQFQKDHIREKRELRAASHEELRSLEKELAPIFALSPESVVMKIHANFSTAVRALKSRGGLGPDYGDGAAYFKPQYIKSPLNGDVDEAPNWKNRFLLLKLGENSSIAIGCTPIKRNGRISYRYDVHQAGYEHRVFKYFDRLYGLDYLNNERFFSGGWRASESPYKQFESRKQLIDFVKDKIAETLLLEAVENSDSNLLTRGTRLAAKAALLSAFLYSCTPVFGEEADPANDFGSFEADRDVPELSVDMK